MGNKIISCQSSNKKKPLYDSKKLKKDVLDSIDNLKREKTSNLILSSGKIIQKVKKYNSWIYKNTRFFENYCKEEELANPIMESLSDIILRTQFKHVNNSIYDLMLEYKIDNNLNSAYNNDIFKENYSIVREVIFKHVFNQLNDEIELSYFNNNIKSFNNESSNLSKSQLLKDFSEDDVEYILAEEYNNFNNPINSNDKYEMERAKFKLSDKKLLKPTEKTVTKTKTTSKKTRVSYDKYASKNKKLLYKKDQTKRAISENPQKKVISFKINEKNPVKPKNVPKLFINDTLVNFSAIKNKPKTENQRNQGDKNKSDVDVGAKIKKDNDNKLKTKFSKDVNTKQYPKLNDPLIAKTINIGKLNTKNLINNANEQQKGQNSKRSNNLNKSNKSILLKDSKGEKDIDEYLIENLDFISSEEEVPISPNANSNTNTQNKEQEKDHKGKFKSINPKDQDKNERSNTIKSKNVSRQKKLMNTEDVIPETLSKLPSDNNNLIRLTKPEVVKRKGTIDYEESKVKIIPHNLIIDVRNLIDLENNIAKQKQQLEEFEKEISRKKDKKRHESNTSKSRLNTK